MGGLADEPETDAGRFGPLHRERGGRHRRDRTEAVAAIEHESRGAVVNKTRGRLGIDLAAGDQVQVARQPRHAMAVAAAQVRPHQAVGDDARVRRARAGGNQRVADEAAKLVVADPNTAQCESPSLVIPREGGESSNRSIIAFRFGATPVSREYWIVRLRGR